MSALRLKESFLSLKTLNKINFRSIGKNVKISRYARIYRPEQITIKDNVRIDDFCLISAGKYIEIGNNVHIASHCGIWGQAGIKIEDFSGISSGCKLYSESDDFSGNSLTGPTVPDLFRKYKKSGPILIGRHVVIGANSVVLPDVTIEDGAIIGCNSLVNTKCNAWKIYAGSPIKVIKDRSNELLELEEMYYGIA